MTPFIVAIPARYAASRLPGKPLRPLGGEPLVVHVARRALAAGAREVWVATDACASRTERNRDPAFARLAGAGAELVTTEMVLFEWLRTAEHPSFKEVHALIR